VAKPINCQVIVPEAEDATHEGCAVLTKRRAFIIPKGQCGLAQWTMRWGDGQTADLSSCFPETSSSESASASVSGDLTMAVRFMGCDRTCVLAQVEATIVDAATGLVQFQVPDAVCQQSGIYQFQIAVLQGTSVVFADGGLISVEHGMWGDTSQMTGPPTLQEIRMHLRDRAAENDLLQAVEFDDAEILDAIKHPVMYWNEVPPPLEPLNCNTFPFRHHWRNAIVAELLFTAAHHYVRNKMNSQSGGLNVDDKAKDKDYLAIAMLYKQEWQEFVKLKKVSINAHGWSGSMGSSYGY
jgi:hypothetical protein